MKTYRSRSPRGERVPQHVVTEYVDEDRVGSIRDIAWFYEKEDAEEYAKWKQEQK